MCLYDVTHIHTDLDTINSMTLTPMYATATYPQTAQERGDRKEKSSGFCFAGFLYRILIPRFMKGFVKSMTCSRAYEIVSDATAMSAV